MSIQQKQEIRISTADPSALGLFGLAMVTLVASTQKMGITTGLSYVVPWAVFLGAFAQLTASILDFKKENLFGGTAFGAYAFFWMAVATSWLMKLGAFGPEIQNDIDVSQLGYAFVGYLIFSVAMTIGATQTNKVLFIIFVFIDFLFIGLSFNTLGIMTEAAHALAAYSELIIALLSFYLAAANVLNHQFKKVILPIGKPISLFN